MSMDGRGENLLSVASAWVGGILPPPGRARDSTRSHADEGVLVAGGPHAVPVGMFILKLD